MSKGMWAIPLALLGLFIGTMAIYWFNLDNKAIYYGVRPLLDSVYDRQHRDVKL